ncbi:hypothetical protein Pyrfu_0746 [Pyrolobus fumarii 1A]|uniref:Uncharacterized protein n=1 Tax=Pyrolobus fumarii (strain DSM 11204 / 1A) TaxID=694429 RepID=G0EDD0_PYRF1|nr:hypothetical protein [Pyrolobus fumarii]AEM38615.1 hypothetical protein Pyrfu_0746 [Pyrolobus fumarii 1A]
MPKVDAGWLLVPIEELMRSSIERLSWSVECRCILVDEPFTTIVEESGERIPVAVGSGSILCPPECKPPLRHVELAVPAWARGVVIEGDECPATGDVNVLGMLSDLTGVTLVDASVDRVLEEGGVAAKPSSLDLEPLGESCGVAEPMLPTHPLAAPLADNPRLCVDEVVAPVRGGRWWGGAPLARLGRVILAYRYGVVRGWRPEALLLTARPSRDARRLILSYALGVLHACGRRE